MPLVTRNSTSGNVFKEDTEPLSWATGDVWINTSTTPFTIFINNAGTARNIGITLAGDTVPLGIELAIGA